MKKFFLFLAVSTTLLFTSCTDETIIEENFYLGQTFEVTTDFSFNPNANLYETLITIPGNIEVFESDAILVYRLEKTVQAPDGSGADAWSQLPQNFFLQNGDIIQYVFNHTFFDVEVLIDGDYDPVALGTEFTDDQVFRIVVVPSEFADANLTMDEAIETFNLQL